MQLQRILAADARAAKEQALARFGPDVLIVSTAKVGDRTELIVAIDLTETPPRPPAPAPQAAARFQSLLMAQPGAASEPGTVSAMPAPSTRAMPAWASASAPPDSRWPDPASPQAPAERHGAHGLDGGDAMLGWQAAAPAATPGTLVEPSRAPDWAVGTQALVGSIRDELAALRREVRRGHAGATLAGAGRWAAGLGEAGVPAGLRPPLADALAALHDAAAAAEPDDATLAAALHDALRARLPAPAALPLAPGLHLLAGPPGAGKTLMAARWARRAVERLGANRVTLVGWYDARPGAWGQLQLLGARLGVDTLRATDAATLALLLDDLPADRLVLVDTSAPLVDTRAPMQRSAGGLDSPCWHLVLPADASRTMVQRWAPPPPAGWSGLWISRLDTGLEPWPLLQLACEAGLPVLAASQGDDLDALDPGFDAAALLQRAAQALAAELSGSAESAAPRLPPARPVERGALTASNASAAVSASPGMFPVPAATAATATAAAGLPSTPPRRSTPHVAPQADVEIPQFVPSPRPSGVRDLRAAGALALAEPAADALATPQPTAVDAAEVSMADTASATLTAALQAVTGAVPSPTAAASGADPLPAPAEPPAPRRARSPRMNAAAQRAAAAAANSPVMPPASPASPASADEAPRAPERRAAALLEAGAADMSVDRAAVGASLRARSTAPTFSKATHA